ncbi:Alpha/Beta hydrolase protein [Mycena vulgaris]|nr:Alpha/Beta hydrolase protein [Mycena vulgaris]
MRSMNRFCGKAVAALLVMPLAWAQTAPIVDLGYAQYQGTVNTANNITNFLGIRYAAAPSGEASPVLLFRILIKEQRRFALQSAATSSKCDRCPAQPNACLQAPEGASSTNPLETRATELVAAEDCLFLNVYYPSDVTGAPLKDLPTVVWIHGGGYLFGAARAFNANGEDIIRQSNRGVVVVLIQYRLGVFGT